MFTIKNNRLVKNPNPELIVVITKPTVKYDLFLSPSIDNKKKYCYYQMVKYSNWSNENKNLLIDKENSIHVWNNFLISAPDEVKKAVK